MPDFDSLRAQMVSFQIKARGVHDVRVLHAMGDVRRHEFVNLAEQAFAYEDRPLPIGLGQTISQPYVVAWMTELLQISASDHVLEIGTGCAYQTAVLSQLARHVYSVELQAELSQQGALNLERAGATNVSLKIGDGYRGWSAHAPYPCIILTAAPTEIPAELVNQLATGGRLVLPVGAQNAQQLVRLTKAEDGNLKLEQLGGVSFVPLLHAEQA